MHVFALRNLKEGKNDVSLVPLFFCFIYIYYLTNCVRDTRICWLKRDGSNVRYEKECD